LVDATLPDRREAREGDRDMKSINRRNRMRRQRGAALVEYGLIIAGVALVSAAAISTFGHKTSDLIAAVAVVLPGAHQGDNGPIQSGHLIETSNVGTNGSITLDAATIAGETQQARLGQNLLGGTAGDVNGMDGLIIESR
jgi:Flp pilus assembly pilin Flp